jgi:hypothetical protein
VSSRGSWSVSAFAWLPIFSPTSGFGGRIGNAQSVELSTCPNGRNADFVSTRFYRSPEIGDRFGSPTRTDHDISVYDLGCGTNSMEGRTLRSVSYPNFSATRTAQCLGFPGPEENTSTDTCHPEFLSTSSTRNSAFHGRTLSNEVICFRKVKPENRPIGSENPPKNASVFSY